MATRRTTIDLVDSSATESEDHDETEDEYQRSRVDGSGDSAEAEDGYHRRGDCDPPFGGDDEKKWSFAGRVAGTHTRAVQLGRNVDAAETRGDVRIDSHRDRQHQQHLSPGSL
ncbi:unnamed protein product [Globisporangium polare]